jgi:hypothetical protein
MVIYGDEVVEVKQQLVKHWRHEQWPQGARWTLSRDSCPLPKPSEGYSRKWSQHHLLIERETEPDEKPRNGKMAESLRTSARRLQNASSLAPAPTSATKTGKRGTKRGADGAPLAPAATVDEDGIKQSLGFVWEDAGSVKEEQKDVDVSDEAAAPLGVLGKKDKQRLLAVLTAWVISSSTSHIPHLSLTRVNAYSLSLPPNESNIQDDASAAAFANAKKRARFMQLILDQAFLAPTEDGQMDSKMSTETTQAVPGPTLRSMLTRNDTFKTDDLLVRPLSGLFSLASN